MKIASPCYIPASETNMIALAVTWMAHEGSEEKVADIFRKLQTASRAEPGCLFYEVHRHLKDKRRFFIYEQYLDDHAIDAHRNSPHFQLYVREELHPIAARVEGELYKPLDEG
ncbi:MAG: putative quinol monooxygenase [Limisphaerales bacterium]